LYATLPAHPFNQQFLPANEHPLQPSPGQTYAQLGSPMAVLHHHEPDDPATLSLFIAPEVGPFTITLQGKGKDIITKDSAQLSLQGDGSYYVTAVHPYHLQPSASLNVKSLLVEVSMDGLPWHHLPAEDQLLIVRFFLSSPAVLRGTTRNNGLLTNGWQHKLCTQHLR
jgi:hypothetical protein